MKNIYDLTVIDRKQNKVNLSEFKGKVLLIVNTATHCGFTKQYDGLRDLYEKYKDQGFEILDFPCNQFAEEAPESNDEIYKMCKLRFDINFRQFWKIDVNGPNESPLYTWLKSQKSGLAGSNIKWNFTKFLVDRNGKVVARYAPSRTPKSLEKEIEKLLAK